jgi:hypothetical protein
MNRSSACDGIVIDGDMHGIESIQSLINGIYIYQKIPQSMNISVPSFHRVRY